MPSRRSDGPSSVEKDFTDLTTEGGDAKKTPMDAPEVSETAESALNAGDFSVYQETKT